MTTAEVRLPNFLIGTTSQGSFVAHVTDIGQPVRLARYAVELDRIGSGRKAALVRAALVSDNRCWRCGRRLTNARTVETGLGRDCRK
jgi:hypothetical protein